MGAPITDREATELATIATEVAQAASRIVMAGYRMRPRVGKKGPADLVTEYDVASEGFILERLAELSPGVPVCAEERGDAPSAGLGWYCDPLDGTTNFVHGHPFFAVSIGAMVDGHPVAGAVVAPALGLTWAGISTAGQATRAGDPCRVSTTATLGDALLATGFPPDRTREPHNNFAAYLRAKRAVRGVRRCGSAAIDLCMVADGTYDGYWERSLHAWDLAAGAAIVLGAGGRITALDGEVPNLAVGHLIASNGLLHPQLLGLLGEAPMILP